jgi:hypothetical protein
MTAGASTAYASSYPASCSTSNTAAMLGLSTSYRTTAAPASAPDALLLLRPKPNVHYLTDPQALSWHDFAWNEPSHASFSPTAYPPNCAPANSAKKRSSYSARTETGRDGEPTPVRFADERLALNEPEDNGFQSDIGRQWRIRRAMCRCAGCQHSVRA